MLFLISLYCTRFLGDWTINFTTNSSGKTKFSSTSSAGEQITLDNLRLNQAHSDREENENGDEHNWIVSKQSSFQSNKILSDKLKPQPEFAHLTKKLKPKILNNMSTLSFRDRRRQIDQQLRDAIRIHHERNFIQPRDEACIKRFPICILVGVTKCGTRELIDFLNLHPHIETYPSTLKSYEMPYFATRYKQGDEWLLSQMPCTYSNQITLMKHSGYFHNPVVPERIKRFNNSIKLILMVREPVSRSVSHYMMEGYNYLEFPNNIKRMKYATTNFSSFVLNSSRDVVETDSFVRHSVYDKPMKLWLKYFNLSQFLIMDNEELKRDPASALNKVERFLGLGHFIKKEMFVLNKDKGFYCVQSNITDTGMACYSEVRGHQKQIEVSEETLSKLSAYFKSKNQRFFEIIGKLFDWK